MENNVIATSSLVQLAWFVLTFLQFDSSLLLQFSTNISTMKKDNVLVVCENGLRGHRPWKGFRTPRSLWTRLRCADPRRCVPKLQNGVYAIISCGNSVLNHRPGALSWAPTATCHGQEQALPHWAQCWRHTRWWNTLPTAQSHTKTKTTSPKCESFY